VEELYVPVTRGDCRVGSPATLVSDATKAREALDWHQPDGHHSPLTYRVLFRLFGFTAAERIAEQVHALRSRLTTKSQAPA
jgi:hypothetical protein